MESLTEAEGQIFTSVGAQGNPLVIPLMDCGVAGFALGIHAYERGSPSRPESSSDPQEMELQETVSHWMWLLGTELSFSARSVSALSL